MNRLRGLRFVLLASYAGLLFTLCVWYFVLDPPQYLFSTVLRIVYLAVLLLPLKGLLNNRPRVYLWSSYLILIYFSHAVIETYANAGFRALAVLELVFSFGYFAAATLCARATRQQAR